MSRQKIVRSSRTQGLACLGRRADGCAITVSPYRDPGTSRDSVRCDITRYPAVQVSVKAAR